MALKIAHFATFSPNRCGLYATARDMIAAERSVGIDAEMVDVHLEKGRFICSEGLEDGWLKTVGTGWAEKADLFVCHSAVPKKLRDSGTPIILCLHGRPESSFLLDFHKKMPTIDSSIAHGTDKRYWGFISFWPEYLYNHSRLLPKDKLFYVPAMVDLKHYTPKGVNYSFKKEKGSPNIIIADIWREDVTPYNVLYAAARFRTQYCPDAKIHLYGIPKNKKDTTRKLTEAIKKTAGIGDICPLITNIGDVFRAGDFLVTPHCIATRVVREALACGLPIVAGTGCKYTPYTADSRNQREFVAEIARCWKETKGNYQPRIDARLMAEKHFGFEQAGKAAQKVFDVIIARQKVERAKWDKTEGLRGKKYKSYDDYTAHQKSKLDDGIDWLKSYDKLYPSVLKPLVRGTMKPKSKVLCLGARTGSEVKAFLELGHFATGIDLNPGKDNKYVVTGDFHNLQYADASIDAVYTNSVDHSLNLDKMIGEVKRVLVEGGKFLMITLEGEDKYAAQHWENEDRLQAAIEKHGFTLAEKKAFKQSPLGFKNFYNFQKCIPATVIPGAVKESGLKLSLIYNPLDTKMRPDSYSTTYRNMADALCRRFAGVQHVTESCSSKDIEGDVVMFFDVHSSHEIEIEGIEGHSAVKYSYFDDPHQIESSQRYGSNPALIHKLGPEQRLSRARDRGVQHIICPYRDGYHRYFSPYFSNGDAEKLLWFPIAPDINHYTGRMTPLVDRKAEVLANGAINDGGRECYDFRQWAFQRPGITFVPHAMKGKGTPGGNAFPAYLAKYAGALALMDQYPVPKYMEIPLAGCVCFVQAHEEYKALGFVDGENCLHVTRHNFDDRIHHFRNHIADYQLIADAGRKLVESKWTSVHFADHIYEHAQKILT